MPPTPTFPTATATRALYPVTPPQDYIRFLDLFPAHFPFFHSQTFLLSVLTAPSFFCTPSLLGAVSHAGVPAGRGGGAVSRPRGGGRSREEEAADRHQEAGGQLSRQVPQGGRAEHALHRQAGGRHRVRQQHPPGQTLHLHPGHRTGDQRLGPGPAGHVRGREEEAGHPRRAGLRRPGSSSQDPRRSHADLRGGAAEHREEIRPLTGEEEEEEEEDEEEDGGICKRSRRRILMKITGGFDREVNAQLYGRRSLCDLVFWTLVLLQH